jgi:thermitase
MRRLGVLIVVLMLGLSMLPPGSRSTAQCPVQPGYAPEISAAFVPGQLLVRFRPAFARQRAEQLLEIEGVRHLRRIEALDTEVLQLPPWLSVSEAMERLLQYREVEVAEPNYVLQVAQVDDPGLSNQWAPQQIEAPAAWALTPGDPATIIAIADTGIDTMHSELAPNIWTNPGEIAANGLDDDGNGYIDDVHGWDFANGDPEPLDDHFHGTHVAGIVAAADNDNPEGLVGICPYCTLMAVKVLDANGSAPLDVVANGMIYAADNGARVINLSLGSSLPAATLESAVDYAWNHGAVVVAAAGNNGAEIAFYPAAFANAVGVASTSMQDYRSCFSNYGSDLVSVAAPGELIYSTVPRDASGNEGYATHSGTSMASPHVSGLVGLLFSQDPARTNAEVRALLESTAEDLGPAGGDPFFGAGRINARRALTADTSPTPLPGGLFATSPIASAYANARKLVRDAGGDLHLVWHRQDGDQYQVVSATSTDGGLTWSAPQVVFSSADETYQPALALDGTHLDLVFSSLQGAAHYRVWFSRRALGGDTWMEPRPVTDGSYDAVRPALFFDRGSDRLHLVAGSLDNAPYVAYARSDDAGATWSQVSQVNVSTGGAENSRYAAVHAYGDHIYLAGRTVELVLGLLPRYRVFTARSTDGGRTWGDLTILAEHVGFLSGAYGVSLAGMGDRLYVGYEHAGAVHFRHSQDGVVWTEASNLGSGHWPSVTQASDGQGWILWESEGSLLLRHYTGEAWAPAETVLQGSSLSMGYYPNLKLGASGERLEWVFTHCSGSPFRLVVDGRPVPPGPTPPVSIYLPIVLNQKP